jgi:cystathionine beta-lyase/cystathionine gamma-synthase
VHHNKGFGTRAIHAGQEPDPTTGAIMTPVYQTSTYVQESPGVIKDDYDYARSANPTRKALEANLASLEGVHSSATKRRSRAALRRRLWRHLSVVRQSLQAIRHHL